MGKQVIGRMHMSYVEPVTYTALCKSADITPFDAHLNIDDFSNLEAFEKRDANERVSNALVVLLSMIKHENVKVQRCDSVLIDSLINRIDEMSIAICPCQNGRRQV